MSIPLTGDQVRTHLSNSNITCVNITPDEIKQLRKVLNSYLKESGIYGGTAKLTRTTKSTTQGHYFTMSTSEWKSREAVSFNTRDGNFISIAGWASNANAQPIMKALMEWSYVIRP